MKQRKVAIFDIDGTIFRSSLLVELLEAMITEGVLPKSISKEYTRARSKWLDREGSYDDYIWAVITAFRRHLVGVNQKTFMRIAERVVEKMGKRVYCYTRDLIKDLHRKGYYLLAISNSPKIILDLFCQNYGFDHVYGRIYEVDKKDRFTGNIEFLDLISDKAKVLARAVEHNHLTLKGSYGVGDSEGDVQFLQYVDHPICFNPNSKLRAAAKRRGWKVVVERKDVIYQF
jgi:HAD superfamily hydrolase (TIGR01490 family)